LLVSRHFSSNIINVKYLSPGSDSGDFFTLTNVRQLGLSPGSDSGEVSHLTNVRQLGLSLDSERLEISKL